MVPETTKPTYSSPSENHKLLDRQVRDMVNAITSRVSDLQKGVGGGGGGASHHQQADEDDHGIRIITLAGTNTGATMRSEMDDKPNNINPQGLSIGEPEPEALGTYVNSNFQAVNNSIMLGSSYNTNDPGVHLDISDVFEDRAHKPDKHAIARKGKKKEKEAFKSDHSD